MRTISDLASKSSPNFAETARTENIRTIAETAKLMADEELIVLVTLISPKEADRQMAKEIIGDELFSLVYVDTPLEVCEQRDPKGLYKKARAGEIPNFTGIGASFEKPTNPKLLLSDYNSDADFLRALLLE